MRPVRLAAALLLAAAPLAADEPVLVELFTSQGCDACPPADAFLGELAERDDVVALAFHVDYWDYLGWRDHLSTPANTARQETYRDALGLRTIYTPQMVIDGAAAAVGSRRERVLELIERAAEAPNAVEIDLRPAEGRVVVDLTPAAGADVGPADILCFVYEPAQTVAVRAGENAGRQLTYHNPVRVWMRLGEWMGDPLRLEAPAPADAGGVAVVVQARDSLAVLGAASLAIVAAPPVAAAAGPQ